MRPRSARPLYWSAAGATLVLLGVIAWQLADGDADDGRPAPIRTKEVDGPQRSAPARTPPDDAAADSPRYRKLAERARREGVVPVIVRLDAPDPSQANSPAEQTKRRSVIAQRRDALLRQLRGTRYDNFRGFAVVPFVSLHASSGALDVLSRSPDVLGIEEDRPVAIPEGRRAEP